MPTGSTLIAVTELASTVTVVLPLIPELAAVAVMVSDPNPSPVTIPVDETLATLE